MIFRKVLNSFKTYSTLLLLQVLNSSRLTRLEVMKSWNLVWVGSGCQMLYSGAKHVLRRWHTHARHAHLAGERGREVGSLELSHHRSHRITEIFSQSFNRLIFSFNCESETSPRKRLLSFLCGWISFRSNKRLINLIKN